MRSIAILIAAAGLASCAADEMPVVKWSKPGATYDQFVQDRSDCVREERARTGSFYLGGSRHGTTAQELNPDSFVPCMGARGYVRDPNGYAAPPGEEIPLGQ